MPVPLAPAVIVIQEALGVAFHEQLDPVVTLKDPVPPVLGTEPAVDPSVYEQDSAAWVTVNVWPAAVIVPVRGEAVLLAATV